MGRELEVCMVPVVHHLNSVHNEGWWTASTHAKQKVGLCLRTRFVWDYSGIEINVAGMNRRILHFGDWFDWRHVLRLTRTGFQTQIPPSVLFRARFVWDYFGIGIVGMNRQILHFSDWFECGDVQLQTVAKVLQPNWNDSSASLRTTVWAWSQFHNHLH